MGEDRVRIIQIRVVAEDMVVTCVGGGSTWKFRGARFRRRRIARLPRLEPLCSRAW